MKKIIKGSSAVLAALSLCASSSLAFAATDDGHTIGDGYTGHTTTAADGHTIGDSYTGHTASSTASSDGHTIGDGYTGHTSTAADGHTIGDDNGSTSSEDTSSSEATSTKEQANLGATVAELPTVNADGSGTLEVSILTHNADDDSANDTVDMTVTFTANTTVTAQNGGAMKISNLVLGEKINLTGTQTFSTDDTGDAVVTFSAKSIKVNDVFATGTNKLKVNSVDTSTNTIYADYSRAGKTYLVQINYSDSTVFTKGGKTATESDVQVGGKIKAKGLGRIDAEGSQITTFEVSSISIK